MTYRRLSQTGDTRVTQNGTDTRIWDGGVTDYYVEYRTSVGPGPWIRFADTVTATTGIDVTGLTNGVKYDFRVAAVTSFGRGAWKEVLQVTFVDHPGTIASSWGTWTAVSIAQTSHPGTITSSWGTWTATSSAGVAHPATVAVSWGTWTGTAVGTVTAEVITGTITTSWGTWTATSSGTVTAEVITGTVANNWGTWTATSSATRATAATVAVSWGTWTGTAVGVRTTAAAVVSPWGTWTGVSVGVVAHPATVTQPWGTWTATAIALPIQRNATITSSWGTWVSAASGRRTSDWSPASAATTEPGIANIPGTIVSPWGPWVATATAGVSHSATITSNWSVVQERILTDTAPDMPFVGSGTWSFGVRFVPLSSGRITHVRYWSESGETTALKVWSGAGATLATVTDTSPPTQVWREVALSTPVDVTAGQPYVTSLYTAVGHAWTDDPHFQTAHPHISEVEWQYVYGNGFPNEPDLTSYYIDVVLEANAWIATGIANVQHVSTVVSPWGTWTATAAGTVIAEVITATVASPWGTWTAVAAGTVTAEVITGTITSPWGTWTATASGTVVAEEIPATVSAAWGTWTATAVAQAIQRNATITSPWGTWTAIAAGTVTAEVITASITSLWGTWTATSAAGVDHPATVISPWGTWSGTAVAQALQRNATIASSWGTWTGIVSRAVSTFPIVEGSVAVTNDESLASATKLINLPPGIVAGNRLVVAFRSATSVVTPPTDFLLAASVGGTSYAYWKVATGTEGATVDVVLASAATRLVAHAYRLSGAEDVSGEFSITDDPPAHIPGWGSANTLWITWLLNRRSDSTVTAPPSGYGGFVTTANASSTATSRFRISTATRNFAASSDDPGTFTTSGVIDSPAGLTIAVEPGGGGGGGSIPVEHPAIITDTWGTWTGTAIATTLGQAVGAVSDNWGTWAATAVAVRTISASVVSPWGTWAATATGVRAIPATISTNWSGSRSWTGVIAQNTAEGGSNGTTVTAGNSGGASGTAWDAVTLAGSSTLIYSSTSPVHDSLSYLITANAGSAALMWNGSGGLGSVRTTGKFCAAGYINWSAWPSTSSPFVLIQQDAAGGTRVCDLRALSTGVLRLAGTDQTSIVDLTTAGAMTTGTTFRWELELDLSASPVAYWVALFAGDSTTPLQSASGTSANLGIQVGRITYGRVQAPDYTAKMDSLGVATAKLGPIPGGGAWTSAGTVIAEVITASITSSWGTWSGLATGTVVAEVISATVASSWGTWTATGVGVVVHPAAVTQSWGTWTATALAQPLTHPATVTSPWGTWVATSTALLNRKALVTNDWGTWTATAIAFTSGQAVGFVTSDWGGWTATASAGVSHPATVTFSWGAWTATAAGTVIAEVIPGAVITPWGTWTATATGTVTAEVITGTVASPWGTWTGTAVAVTTGIIPGTVSTTWGTWTGTATAGPLGRPATITTTWGGWDAPAIGRVGGWGVVTTTWGEAVFTATAYITVLSVGIGNWGTWDAIGIGTLSPPGLTINEADMLYLGAEAVDRVYLDGVIVWELV